MARPKTKEYKPLTVRMDVSVYNKLDSFCSDSGQTKTVAVERALNMYIDDYNKKMEMLASLKTE